MVVILTIMPIQPQKVHIERVLGLGKAMHYMYYLRKIKIDESNHER